MNEKRGNNQVIFASIYECRLLGKEMEIRLVLLKDLENDDEAWSKGYKADQAVHERYRNDKNSDAQSRKRHPGK